MPVIWTQTKNSIPISYESLPYKEGYTTFDFKGAGQLSFVFPAGGAITAPRLLADPSFLVFSVSSDNLIQQDISPLASNYVPGFVNDTLVGNFGSSNGDSLIFIDQGREFAGLPYAQWDFSYLWRVDKVNGVWQATEFAKSLGRQFWHSSSNPIDINGDGILDFSVAALSSAVNVLFLSNKRTGSYDEISLKPYLTEANSGSSALIHLASGRIGVISLPYTPSLPYTEGKFGSILTLNLAGTAVDSTQAIQVRGMPATSALTGHDGFSTIRVLDLNGDNREDFIALGEANDGSSQKSVKLIAFTQDKNGQFTYANDQLGIPFTYTLPSQSSEFYADWTGNQFFISDSNADGVSDIFLRTQLIQQSAIDSKGIRGGLINQNGQYKQLEILTSQINWNANSKPYTYDYIIPTEINKDGVIDYLLVGSTYDQPKTATNPYGQLAHISFLTSSVTPEANQQNIVFDNTNSILRVQGSNQADSFRLNNKITTLEAFEGNDKITVGGGICSIDGGSGFDTAIYSGAAASYTITIGTTSSTVVDKTANRDGTANLTNVERLSFADINVALDTARGDNAGKAYRIYKAAFNRTPDAEGLGFWIASLDSGNSLNNASQGFIGSPEFQRMYGTNSSDTTFLNNIYTNVLGRNYDQSGYDFWLNGLKNGLQRDSLLSQFSESVENCANVAPLIGQGIAYKEYLG